MIININDQQKKDIITFRKNLGEHTVECLKGIFIKFKKLETNIAKHGDTLFNSMNFEKYVVDKCRMFFKI